MKKLIYLFIYSACVIHPAIADKMGDSTGETMPPPVFQRGDTAPTPYADKSEEAQGFIDFFNKEYLSGSGIELPLLTKDDVVWFPPQLAGDTSLEMVVRKTQGQTDNCSDPSTYPIVCDGDNFSTGQFCKACHDSALFVTGGGLPEMSYFAKPDGHDQWLANWSMYGDWNATIMRLAARDPIWQAQIETETSVHEWADPKVIQDVCFSCHGEMGERQLKLDHGNDQTFCTDVFYATIPGYLSENQQGASYPFTGDCEPIKGKPIAEHQGLYAKYGSLARDGVSCETCHRIGPPGKAGRWDGKSYEVFYGKKDTFNVAERQTGKNSNVPVEYEFTATFDVDLDNIMTPDPVSDLDPVPMATQDALAIAQAVDTKNQVSYLKQSVVCGACHVLIVPQIPAAYKPGDALPDKAEYPYYDKPKACESSTFAAATTKDGKGNPVADNCVALGYEQATYLEWINSAFATEQDTDTTCQGCHMPLVTDPNNPHDHTAFLAQATANPSEPLTPKTYRRHRLTGINLPVFEMFVQFPEVLGVATHNDQVPPAGISKQGKEGKFIQNALLQGEMAIVEQATSQANGSGLKPDSVTLDQQAATKIEVLESQIQDNTLNTTVKITNNTGHKFPSGAGFRRAFLKFEVLDDKGNTLWVSGETNPYGALCDGPCTEKDGKWNLLSSELNGGDPKKLQPHYQQITRQDQVQIYEVQTVDDTGMLTSSTLALFHDAKDNRLLPRGWMSAEALGCGEDGKNADSVASVFGINKCSAAYATEPQTTEMLTVNSEIADDPDYMTPTVQGACAQEASGGAPGCDMLVYAIPMSDLAGGDSMPAEVRVTMQYQTIPPGYLASRFKDGFDETKGKHLTATARAIYLTSHLNTNVGLKSENSDNPDLDLSKDWTMSLYQAAKQVPKSKTCETVEAGPIWSNDDAQTKCPNACGGKNYTWDDGQWWTTKPNEESVCLCCTGAGS